MRTLAAVVISCALAVPLLAAAHESHQMVPAKTKAPGTNAVSTPGPNGATPMPTRKPIPAVTKGKDGSTTLAAAVVPSTGAKAPPAKAAATPPPAAPPAARAPPAAAADPPALIVPTKPVRPLTLDDVNKGFKLMKEEAGASCSIACAYGNHSIACKVGQSCNCSCPGGYVSCHCE